MTAKNETRVVQSNPIEFFKKVVENLQARIRISRQEREVLDLTNLRLRGRRFGGE